MVRWASLGVRTIAPTKAASRALQQQVTVHTHPRSALLSLSVIAPEPQLAADLANGLIDELFRYEKRAKDGASAEANHLLKLQIDTLGQQITALRQDLTELALRRPDQNDQHKINQYKNGQLAKRRNPVPGLRNKKYV